MNDGTCVDGINEFTCQCCDGYTGTCCETGNVLKSQTGFDYCSKLDIPTLYVEYMYSIQLRLNLAI